MTCPGEYNIVCEDVGSDFDMDVCECDGQMWVSGDCNEAFLCNKLYPNGGIRGDCRDREGGHHSSDQSEFGGLTRGQWPYMTCGDKGPRK